MTTENKQFADSSTQNKTKENYQDKIAAEEIKDLAAKVAESKSQSSRKNWVIGMMIILIGLLFYAAYSYAFEVLEWLSNPDAQYKDWHALITVTALLIPPTLLGFSLVKSVFNEEAKKKNINLKDLPVSEIGKVLIELGESIIQKIKS